MNIFTVNQVNQVYVLKSDSDVKTLSSSTDVTKSDKLGSVGVGVTADGCNIYFKHLGYGGLNRSDLINIKSIESVKVTKGPDMSRELTAAKITINAEALDSSAPIVGEDYVLNITFQNPVGMSPDNIYTKFGVVHVSRGMTSSDFYASLALSIAKNLSRESVKLLGVYVSASGTDTEVTAATKISDLSDTYDSVVLKEVETDWILGLKQQKPILFKAEPTLVKNGVEDVTWGDVIYSNGTKYTGGSNPDLSIETDDVPDAAGVVVNSKLMADYEYFYMGERADQYRLVGFPNYVPTKYLVDSESEYGYDTIGIHFSYAGDNHAVQKSEKDITFIVPRAAGDSDSDAGALATSLKSAIDTAIGE